MKTIYKYQLKIDDQQVLELPKNRKILCVQVQYGVPSIWVELDNEDKELESVVINTYGTGHPMPNVEEIYIGTYQMHEGDYVFHVFENDK